MSDLKAEDLHRAMGVFLAQQYFPDLLFLSPRAAEEYPRILRREEIRARKAERRWRGRHYLNRIKRGKAPKRRRRR